MVVISENFVAVCITEYLVLSGGKKGGKLVGLKFVHPNADFTGGTPSGGWEGRPFNICLDRAGKALR